MTIKVDFSREGDDLVMLLPVVNSLGERVALERWSFDEVVVELERLVEAAAEGDRYACRIYQRLVWPLRKLKLARETMPPPAEGMGAESGEQRAESPEAESRELGRQRSVAGRPSARGCDPNGKACDRPVCLGFDCPERVL